MSLLPYVRSGRCVSVAVNFGFSEGVGTGSGVGERKGISLQHPSFRDNQSRFLHLPQPW